MINDVFGENVDGEIDFSWGKLDLGELEMGDRPFFVELRYELSVRSHVIFSKVPLTLFSRQTFLISVLEFIFKFLAQFYVQ